MDFRLGGMRVEGRWVTVMAIRSVEASAMTPTAPKRPDELRAECVAAAQAALDETLQSGEGYDAKEVHDYLRAKAANVTTAARLCMSCEWLLP